MIPEDAVEPKPSAKKRIIVAGLLAMAAIGTHWLSGRTIVPMQSDPQRSAVATSEKLIPGPNSILGDAVGDKTTQVLASGADLGQYHLDVEGVVDQAGLTRLLNGVAPVSGQVVSDSVGQASAVPEPCTAGLFLLAAAPVLVRRKGRPASKV